MKIVVLTNKGSLYGKKIINELISNRITVDSVVVIRQPISYQRKLFRYVKKRVGILDALYFTIQRVIHKEKIPHSWNGNVFIGRYDDLGVPILYSAGTNSSNTVEILTSLRPDLLLLGQTGIVKRNIIEIPAKGTLNSHPGILPTYRGIDSAKWAIYYDDYSNVGVSVHWVDTGVDTGSIIFTKHYRIREGETLESLNTNLYNLAAQSLVRVVKMMMEEKELAVVCQRKKDGKQYYKMSRKKERVVKKKLQTHRPVDSR